MIGFFLQIQSETRESYCLMIWIELIDIEGSRREILEAFWKSPYLNVTYCIDLKIGTWPHDFRKRNKITRAENTYYLLTLLFHQRTPVQGKKRTRRLFKKYRVVPYHYSTLTKNFGQPDAYLRNFLRMKGLILNSFLKNKMTKTVDSTGRRIVCIWLLRSCSILLLTWMKSKTSPSLACRRQTASQPRNCNNNNNTFNYIPTVAT